MESKILYSKSALYRPDLYTGLGDEAAEEKQRQNEPHACTAKKKPVLISVRTEKTSGGNMGRRIETYKMPGGEIHTEVSYVPVTDKSIQGSGSFAGNADIKTGQKLDVIA